MKNTGYSILALIVFAAVFLYMAPYLLLIVGISIAIAIPTVKLLKKSKNNSSNKTPIVSDNGTVTFSPKYLNTKKSLIEFKNFVVIDFETTGFSAIENDIIEVACLKIKNGEISKYKTLVDPRTPIPKKITEITGIRKKDVKGKPTITEVAKKIYDFCEDLPLVAHNASFDMSFLQQAYQKINIEKNITYVDTLELSRQAFPYFHTHKLSYLISELNLSDGPQTHRAMDDAICTKLLLDKCIKKLLEDQKVTYEPDYLRSKKALENFKNFVVIDFETTGPSARENDIIEVACLKIKNGEISKYETLVDPRTPIPRKTTEITGIRKKDVDGKPDIWVVAKEIYNFCENLPLVAHNAPFDMSFLKQAYRKVGIEKEIIYVDTLYLSRKVFKDFPNHKLNYLISELNLNDGPQTHRAMNNAICTKKLLDICIEKLLEEKRIESENRKKAKEEKLKNLQNENAQT